MSMTPVDPVAVSVPAQASALLTQIAARMFDWLVSGQSQMALSPDAFDAWKLLREMAHLYGTHGLVKVNGEQLERLTAAVEKAHELFHGGPAPLPGRCYCEMALKAHALGELLRRVQFETATDRMRRQ